MPISFSSVWLTLSGAATGSSSSSSACASGTFSVRFDATRSAIRPGSSTLCTTIDSSGWIVLPSPDSLSMFWRTDRSSASTLDRTRPSTLILGALQAHAVTRAVGHEALDARAAQPLHQHLQPALGQLAHAHDHPDRAGAVELLRASDRRRWDRAARPGSRADRPTPAPWPPPPSRRAASRAAARSCTGRPPGRESAAAAGRRGSVDPLQTPSFAVTRYSITGSKSVIRE